MATSIFTPSLVRVVDSAGTPVNAGKMYFYRTGGTALASAYLDEAATSASSNPAISDGEGLFDTIYLDTSVTYRVVCTNSDGTDTLFDIDPVRVFSEVEAAGYSDSASTSAAAAATSAASAGTSEYNAELGKSGALTAAGTAGFFPSATAHVPKGILSVAISNGGTGGTDGTYTVGLTGDNLTEDAEIELVVGGGVVTSATIVSAGWVIGASVTVGSVDTSSITGLSGATFTLTGGVLVTNGLYWLTNISGGFEYYQNDAGSAAASGYTLPNATTVNGTIVDILPFKVAPAVGHELNYVKKVTIWEKDSDGNSITIPADIDICVKKWGVQSSTLRYQFRLAQFEPVSTYTEFARENPTNGSQFEDGSSFTGGEVIIPLYAVGTFLGVADGTQVGEAIVYFTGAAIGTYNSDLDNSVGGVDTHKISLDASEQKQIDDRVQVLIDASTNNDPFFIPTATQQYITSFITNGNVEFGDPEDDYYINMETIYYSGIPLYRIKFHLWSTNLNARVAYWESSETTDTTGSLPETVFLTNVASGTPQSGYEGISATLKVDWASIDWTLALTTFTDKTATGIRRAKILSTQEIESMYENDTVVPARVLTVGATDTDFTSVESAITSLYTSGLTITRSTYPCSDICTYSHPVEIKIVDDAYSEAIVGEDVSGTGTGILIPHGLILRGKGDSILSMATADCPLIEAPFTCIIDGFNLKTSNTSTDSGYVIHIDNVNALSVVSTNDPKILRHRITTLIKNCLIETVEANTAPLLGCGISAGQKIIVKDCTLRRNGASPSTSTMVLVHNSPSTELAGSVEFYNCTSNDGDITSSIGLLQVLKSFTMTVKHKIVVNNTEASTITHSNSAGGNSGWVRVGSLTGITYSTDLDA